MFVHAARGSSDSRTFLLRASSTLGLVFGLPHDDTATQRPLMRFVRMRNAGGGLKNLADPVTRLFWCAGPPSGTGHDPIFINREIASVWEAFSLEPVDLEPLARGFPSLDTYLRTVKGRSAERLFVRLLSRLGVADLSDGDLDVLLCCAQLRPHGIERLMQKLEPSPKLLELTSRLCDEPVSKDAVGALKTWLDDRDAFVPKRVVGPALDSLADANPHLPAMSRSFVGALRSKVAARKRACVVATARNEGPYLLEWIAYHRAVGFEHIFIYSNQNDDGSDALLSVLDSHGIITYVENQIGSTIPSQAKAYSHALACMPEILDYEWALFCDLDEFFVFDTRRFGNVHDYLDAQPATSDAIALQWLWFGNCGALRATGRDQPYTHRFTTRHADVSPIIKTICRPRYFHFSHPHYPFAIRGHAAVFQDCEGEPYQPQPAEFAFSSQPRAGAAAINHYIFKSIDDCLWKYSRNPGDRPYVTGRRAIEIADDIGGRLKTFDGGRRTVGDDRIIGCVADLPGAIRQLRSLPGVDAAATATETYMRRHVRALRDELMATDPEGQTEHAQLVLGLLRGAALVPTA